MAKHCRLLALAALLPSCWQTGASVFTSPESVVRSRAQEDLGCGSVSVSGRAGGGYMARGCGSSASYVCLWTGQTSGGVCTLETGPRDAAARGDVVEDPSRPRGRGRHVPELAAITLTVEACLAPGAGLPLRIQIDAHGTITGFRGPVSTSDEQECVSAALAPVIVRSIPGPASIDTSFPPPPRPPPSDAHATSTTTDLGAWVDAQLAAQRDAVLACVGREVIAVRIEATGGAPRWSLQGDLSGSAEEECVGSVLGDAAPPVQGTVIRVLR